MAQTIQDPCKVKKYVDMLVVKEDVDITSDDLEFLKALNSGELLNKIAYDAKSKIIQIIAVCRIEDLEILRKILV